MSGHPAQPCWILATETQAVSSPDNGRARHLPHVSWPWAHGETTSAVLSKRPRTASLHLPSQGPDGYPGDAGSPGEPGDQGAKVGGLIKVAVARADWGPCPPGCLLPAAVAGSGGDTREAQQRGPVPADQAVRGRKLRGVLPGGWWGAHAEGVVGYSPEALAACVPLRTVCPSSGSCAAPEWPQQQAHPPPRPPGGSCGRLSGACKGSAS